MGIKGAIKVLMMISVKVVWAEFSLNLETVHNTVNNNEKQNN